MIKEFDAIQGLSLSRGLIYVVSVLLIGIGLEVGLRFGTRWALSRNYTWLPAILGALTWQAFFWEVLLGIVSPLLDLARPVLVDKKIR